MRYRIEFCTEPSGRQPVAEFLDKLEPHKRSALLAALQEILAEQGLDVCSTEYGKNLGRGIAEFRLRHSYAEVVKRFPGGAAVDPPKHDKGGKVLLRVFFHPYGDRIILLLAGYDKGRYPSRKRQDAAYRKAIRRLAEFRRSRR